MTTDELLKGDVFDDIRVVVMCGLPGSGKSYLGKKIAKLIGAEYLSSDKVREEIFKTSQLDPVGDEVVFYQSNGVMVRMYQMAIKLVQKGHKVVIDATQLRRERRVQLKLMLKVTRKALLLVVRADEGVVRRRAEESGKINDDGEPWVDAVMRVRGYFADRYKKGLWTWPTKESDGVNVIEVWNN